MRNKQALIIVLLAVLKFILPFLLRHPVWEPHRDEYLYYQQGQHLDLGYLENPSMIGLLAAISSLFGGSFFWIKFWPALFGSLTLLVTAGIVKELGGKLFAQIIAASGILFSAYLRIHFLFQPNFLDIFFWTAGAYWLIRFINTEEKKYLYFLSISLALGWWSKYSVLFFAAAIILSLLLTHHRTVFGRKQFWLASALAILLILPNVFWQYSHNWPLVHHMQELRETQLQYLDKGDFIKQQIVMLLPVTFVWLGGLAGLLRNSKYRVIGLMYLTTIVLLMWGSGKGYYALGAYPMLLAAGGVWLERLSHKRYWIRYTAVLLILVLSLSFIPVLLPVQPPLKMAYFNEKYRLQSLGLLKWEDQENHPLQQDFADMTGWKELTSKAEKFFAQLPDSTKVSTTVYCRNYGQAGAVRWHSADPYFASKVISDNGSFLLWIPRRLYFKNLIFIGGKMPEGDDEVFQHFQKVSLIDSVANPLSRQYGDKIIWFQNASDSAWMLAQKDLNRMKAKFGR